MKKLKYLFFLLFLLPFNVFAMDVPITVSEGQWIDNGTNVIFTGAATLRTIGNEQFYQFKGNNSLAQFLNFNVYYPESQNDNIKSKGWDVSFVVLSYGDFILRLGTSSCFIISSTSAADMAQQFNTDYGIDDINTYKYYNVFCPNARILNTPTPIRMYRTFSSSDYNVNRLIISKIWSFSETSNSNQEITSAITNQTNSINNNINNVNSNITSEQDPNTSSSITEFQNSLASDTPITNLLTLPLTLISAYNTGISASCSPYSFGSLLGTNITFPCINLQQRLGTTLWYTIDSLCCIFLIYSIAMLFVHAFDSLTSLKDDFDDMYVPKHAGKHVGSGVDG